jgi:hypothetical protein
MVLTRPISVLPVEATLDDAALLLVEALGPAHVAAAILSRIHGGHGQLVLRLLIHEIGRGPSAGA